MASVAKTAYIPTIDHPLESASLAKTPTAALAAMAHWDNNRYWYGHLVDSNTSRISSDFVGCASIAIRFLIFEWHTLWIILVSTG